MFIVKLLIAFLLIQTSAFAATYYIDYDGGNDANNGTSKLTPWKRAPGMYGATGNSAARRSSSTSGDSIIFKGGVRWPKEVFSFDWYFGNSTYFGVDATWYTGASWTRPIFDSEGYETTASPEGTTSMMRAYGSNHIVDNIEFKGAAQLHGGDNGYGSNMLAIGTTSGSAVGGEVKNCYFHAWVIGGTATADNSVIIDTGPISAGPDMGLSIHDNVFDGSDAVGSGQSNRALRGSVGHFYRNYVSDVTNGTCCYLNGYVWGNTFRRIANDKFEPSMHSQMYEPYGGGDTYVYNNYVYDIGDQIFIGYPTGNGKQYFFNNLFIDDSEGSIQIGSSDLIAGNTAKSYIWNNTIIGPSDADYSISGPAGSPSISEISVKNNLLAGADTSLILWAYTTTQTSENNLQWTTTTLASNGYSASGTYPYFPPSSRPGTDLSSFCSSLTDNGASTPSTACLSDTTLGVTYNATTHTITGVGRTATLRGTTYDIGAYEYTSGGDVTAPVVTITLPVEFTDTYSTSSSTVTLAGTATDAVGVTGVTWANDRGGSGDATCTGCTGTSVTWNRNSIALQTGVNVITITGRDAANNDGIYTLTVTYTASDSTPPVLSSLLPTGAQTCTGAGVANIALSLTTNEAATCRMATTDIAYASMSDDVHHDRRDKPFRNQEPCLRADNLHLLCALLRRFRQPQHNVRDYIVLDYEAWSSRRAEPFRRFNAITRGF